MNTTAILIDGQVVRQLAVVDAVGRVYECEPVGPVCFADKGYYDQVARTLDALEEKSIKRLRGVLIQTRDTLISRVMRGALPDPREVRLSKLVDFRRGVRDLLETASARGGRDARSEVREQKKRVKGYAFDPNQPRAPDGKWTAGAYAPGGLHRDRLKRVGKAKPTTLSALSEGFNAAQIKKQFGSDEGQDILNAINRHSDSTKIKDGDRALLDKLHRDMGVELKRDTLLYRGLDLKKDEVARMVKAVETGKSVVLRNHRDRYVPTSTSKFEAQEFGRVLLEVVAPKGAKVLPIGRLNGYGEKEITLDRGSYFRVAGVFVRNEHTTWSGPPRKRYTFRVELVKSVHQARGSYAEDAAVVEFDLPLDLFSVSKDRYSHFSSDVVAVEIDGVNILESEEDFAFDPNQPRDEDGQWSDGGGGWKGVTEDELKKPPRSTKWLANVMKQNMADLNELEIIRGRGYFYATGKFKSGYEFVTEGIYVYRLNHLSTERWLPDLKSKINQARVSSDPLKEYISDEEDIDHHQYAAPAVFRPRNAAKWMREKEFYVTDLLDKTVTANVRGILVNALKTGELNGAVADKIWNAFEAYIGDPNVLKGGEPLSPARLETIVRTNLTEAYNHGRMMEYTDEDMLPFLNGIRYSAILDERTTPVCSFLDGKVFTPMDPDLTDLLPPNHFNCRSIVVPIVVGEAIELDDFITPDEVGHAKSLADAKFLEQES